MTVAYPRKLRNSLSARDIMSRVVVDREVHHVTLNRYRFNEQRSCKDLTELIELLDGKPKQLVQDLSHHVADEARHACWLTDLLIDIDSSVGTPPGLSYIDEFERLVDQADFSSEDQKEEALISALAAINVTEKRGCEYFSAHIHALNQVEPSAENTKIKATLEKILPEEVGHVRWGNRWLGQIAKKSAAHRLKVERAKLTYAAIEQAAYEVGMDITMGAEIRRVSKLIDIVVTLPLQERPQYLMERLPHTLLDPKLQLFRFEAARKAWDRDPQKFFSQFVPMFIQGVQSQGKKPQGHAPASHA